MNWPYEAYVTLLTDLLSPDELPLDTLASIAQHVATVEDTALARLVSAMLQSPVLYGSTSYQEPSTSSHKPEAVALPAAQNVFHAVRQGIDTRIQAVKKDKGNTWFKRRKLRRSLETMLEAISSEERNREATNSLKALALSVATLRAVQDDAARKDAFVKQDSALLQLCERHVCSSISRHLELQKTLSLEVLPTGEPLLIAWLFAQVIPEIPSERLGALANPTFFDFSFAYVKACFMNGHIFADMSTEVFNSQDGITWPENSPSSQRLKSVKGSLPHLLLGRFSRSLGKVIESVTTTHVFHFLTPHLEGLESLGEKLHRDWAACVWSNASGPEDLHPDTRGRDEPWAIFKTLLFTLTMIFSSLISLMNAMPLSTHRHPSEITVNLASCALRTFSSIFFITSKFGTNGFGAYQNVWFGAVDLVSQARPQKIQQILKTCEPRFGANERRSAILPAALPRSRMTYWLNLVEQLVLHIPEDYLEVTVIPTLRPYLTNKQDIEAFESAHSVILAIFSHKRGIAVETASWYSDLLLRSYPEQLTISQLRLAYAKMVGCLTDLQSKEADLCISKLLEAIEHTSPGPSIVQSPNMPLAEVSQSVTAKVSEKEDPAESAKKLEVAALRSRRGHLLLVLIDQLSTVHLQEMEELLPKVQELLRAEEPAPRESRVALIQVLFNTLSGAMDMIKRESAAKWWLEHAAQIEVGENTREEIARISQAPQARL